MGYTLILIMTLWGDGSQAGYGGVSVNTQRYDTLGECEAVRDAFLNDMPFTVHEVTNRKSGQAHIARKAQCVNTDDQWGRS